MSYIQIIRDSIETLASSNSIDFSNLNSFNIVQYSLLFFFQNIKVLFLNFFSFNWIKNFIQFPIYIPQINESILREQFFFENFNSINPYFQDYSLNTNKLFIGFLNGLFLALPCSCSNLIFIRRFLIQGKIAGFFSLLGNIIGQVFFLASILFGFRELIFPVVALQPFLFVLGIGVLVSTLYFMIHEKGFKQINLSEKSSLIKIFLLNFFLIWTEQSCIYQFLGNINFGPEPTILEGFFSNNFQNYFFIHFAYLIGIFLGGIFFNLLFVFILENFADFIQIRFRVLKSSFLISSNFILLSAILTLSFSSIPYYGLDYILTSPLGFIPQDKNFQNTIFSQYNIKDPVGMFGYFSLNMDTSTYGRGLYFKEPGFESFEELNYSAEYANFIRQGYIPLFTQYKKQASKFTDLLIQKKNDSTDYKEDLKKTKDLYNEKNFFQYPTFYLVDKNFNPSLYFERRYDWNYKKLQNLTFTMTVERGFNRLFFRDDFVITPPKRSKIVKQKFYSNPIYKFLLNTDIDLFLNRELNLSNPVDEKKIHEKRLLMNRYTDSLRFYTLLPYANEFQYFFNGTKSFADRIYNQQFKGTLKIVRRLFSISFYSINDNKNNVILKYDQPLFTENQDGKNLYHEELVISKNADNVFIELINQNPFYLGWDDNLKKMILTNRTLPKNKSIFENRSNINNTIEFSVWPLKLNNLGENKKLLFDDLNTMKNNKFDLSPLFEYVDSYTGIGYYKTVPTSINNILAPGVDIFPPNRSGFLWPGTNINYKSK